MAGDIWHSWQYILYHEHNLQHNVSTCVIHRTSEFGISYSFTTWTIKTSPTDSAKHRHGFIFCYYSWGHDRYLLYVMTTAVVREVQSRAPPKVSWRKRTLNTAPDEQVGWCHVRSERSSTRVMTQALTPIVIMECGSAHSVSMGHFGIVPTFGTIANSTPFCGEIKLCRRLATLFFYGLYHQCVNVRGM